MKREIYIMNEANYQRFVREIGQTDGGLNSWNNFVLDDNTNVISINGFMVCVELNEKGDFFYVERYEKSTLYLKKHEFVPVINYRGYNP